MERALEKLDATQVEVQKQVLPFMLDPHLPTKSVNKLEHYKKKFGEERVSVMVSLFSAAVCDVSETSLFFFVLCVLLYVSACCSFPDVT